MTRFQETLWTASLTCNCRPLCDADYVISRSCLSMPIVGNSGAPGLFLAHASSRIFRSYIPVVEEDGRFCLNGKERGSCD